MRARAPARPGPLSARPHRPEVLPAEVEGVEGVSSDDGVLHEPRERNDHGRAYRQDEAAPVAPEEKEAQRGHDDPAGEEPHVLRTRRGAREGAGPDGVGTDASARVADGVESGEGRIERERNLDERSERREREQAAERPEEDDGRRAGDARARPEFTAEPVNRDDDSARRGGR